ncbi:MAG: hypothetical protein WD491_12060 [Balneolales bacterium]
MAQQEGPRFNSDITRLAPIGILTDTVNVWGAVSQRGRFMVPRGTTVTQMLSYTGGPSVGGRGGGGSSESRSIYAYYTRPQIEVYLNRFDANLEKETLEVWTYRLRDPFPEGMRDFELKNGEYITVNIRTRPTPLQYVIFSISTIGSIVGGYFLIERLL